MHDHGQHSHHHSAYDRSFLLGIMINVAFVAIEVAYGLTSNSLALLADAGHNAGDVIGLAIAWGATMLARKAPSERFTYGLQSASIMAALANALLLLIAVWAIGWEALQRIASPQAPAAYTMMGVASAGVLVNGITAWLFHKNQHDLNIRGTFLHMVADAAISLGVVLAGGMILITHWLWIDPAISLSIALVIVIGTWQLLRDATMLALHAAPASVDVGAVRKYLEALPDVAEVHDLHVWAMSTTGVAMSTHLRMPGGHPGDAFIHDVTCELEEHFHIGHSTIQIETGDDECECPVAHHHES